MIDYEIVKQELEGWRDTIGDDIVDQILYNLEEEMDDEERADDE